MVDGRYLKIDKDKLKTLEQLAMNHKVKPTYRRTAIAKDNPRDASGRYSTIPIYSETLQSGPIVDLCRSMLPRGCMDCVQINRNEACTEHVDWNIGDSYTIVFGDYKNKSNNPSTILDMTANKINVIREGKITINDIKNTGLEVQ